MLTLQAIKITDIVPNDYNPNVVDDAKMLQLKKSIIRDGYIQPIVVRPHPEMPGIFVVVDGEHRWTVLKELNYDVIECVVVDREEPEAMIETVNMNNLRGSFDNFRLAEVILSLSQRYSEEELTDLLGYSPLELKNFQDLATFDFNSLVKPPKEKQPEDEPEAKALFFTVMLNQDQMTDVKAGLAKKSFLTDALSLTGICADWLSKNFPNEYLKFEVSGILSRSLRDAEEPETQENETDILA